MGRDYCIKCDKRMGTSSGESYCERCTPVDVDAVRSEERESLLAEIEKRLEEKSGFFYRNEQGVDSFERDQKGAYVFWPDIQAVLKEMREGR